MMILPGVGMVKMPIEGQTVTADSGTSTVLDKVTVTDRVSWLSTVGDRAFPIASAHLWNSLPLHVTVAPSLSLSNFRSHIKSLSLSYPYF